MSGREGKDHNEVEELPAGIAAIGYVVQEVYRCWRDLSRSDKEEDADE
jgi:hypothetical protein